MQVVSGYLRCQGPSYVSPLRAPFPGCNRFLSRLPLPVVRLPKLLASPRCSRPALGRRASLRGASPATEANFDCWERARVDPSVETEDATPVRTIFGYGSLIFRPGFPYVRAHPACVRGYLRRFWQRSCDHRGTPDSPGRVVTLVRAEEAGVVAEQAEVHGVAYDVADEDWEAVLEALDIRERHGYIRTVADLLPSGVALADGHASQAIVYHAYKPHANAAYAGPEAVAETAKVIALAQGPSGRNDEYLFMLKAALDVWALPPDPYLEELVEAVRSVQLLSPEAES